LKLHADPSSVLNTVTGYGPGWIEVNRQRHETAILVMPEGELSVWPHAQVDAIDSASLDAVAARKPEIVLLGTGPVQRFPHPRLAASLARYRIGLDVMDTRAACRTYNILMSEGRKVAAVLLLP
jgi:uncharacterized protein